MLLYNRRALGGESSGATVQRQRKINHLTDTPNPRAEHGSADAAERGLARPAADATPAWRAVAAFAAGTLFFGLAFVHRVAPSVMTTELMRDFAVGGAALGTLSAWYFYTYASIQIPVGMLNDRFGPRRLMTAAVAVCALASFGFAASESLLAASFFRALIGASVAFAFVGTLTIAGYWFAPARFAMLAGAVQSIGMLGAVAGQAPLRYVIEQFGWRAVTHVIGAVAVALAALLFFIVPRRPRNPVASTGDGDAEKHPVFKGFIAVLRNPQSWACAGIGFGMTAIMLAFAGLWAPKWLRDVYNYAEVQSGAVVSMLFLGWAIGAPVMGWLSDYTGRRKPVLLAGILCNSVLFALILFAGWRAPGPLSALFFMLGISGSMMTIAFGCMRELNPPRHGSTAMGLVNMCVVGSGAVMQPVIGWLLDLGWDGRLVAGARVYESAVYSGAFTVLFASNLLALLCVLLLRETYCKQVVGDDGDSR